MTPAQVLTNKIRSSVSQVGCRLFNVHVGKFWAGRATRYDKPSSVMVKAGDVLIQNARLINSGLPGMADLIGLTPVIITEEMVGTTIAVYTSVEVKTTDRPSPEQIAWCAFVQKMGGKAGIARSISEALEIASGSK